MRSEEFTLKGGLNQLQNGNVLSLQGNWNELRITMCKIPYHYDTRP